MRSRGVASDGFSEHQGRERIYYATDCEALIEYDLAAHLSKNDDCSLIIDKRLYRLSVDEKISVWQTVLGRHGVTWERYVGLSSELRSLFDYRNKLIAFGSHDSEDTHDPWRVKPLRRCGAPAVAP